MKHRIWPAQYASEQATVYEMAACEALPSFDPKLTVRFRFFNGKHHKLYNHVVHPIRHGLLPAYMLGFLLRGIVFFGSARSGRWLAPVLFALQIPYSLNVVLWFCNGYARILSRTFDFRFLTVSVGVWFVCFSCAFQDSRIWVLPSCCLDFINAFLVESEFQSSKSVLIAALSSITFFFAVTVALLIGRIDDLKHVTLMSSHHHALTTTDLLLNSMGTIMMLLCRLSYTKYNSVRGHRHGHAEFRVQSNGYHCRIKLQAKQPKQTPTHEPNGPLFDNSGRVNKTMQLLPMQLVDKCKESIDSSQTLVPWISTQTLHPAQIWTMYMIGVIGSMASLCVIVPIFHGGFKEISSYIALTSTSLFCVWVSCYRQRQLMRKLLSSFHYLFLSLQISAAHLCACDMVFWDESTSRGLSAIWLWTQWVLLSDTICPITRVAIRLRLTSLPVVILWVLDVVRLIVVCEVLVQNRWELQDRTFFQYQVASKRVKFRVVPFLFARQVTILTWSTRLLWRVWSRHDHDELLLLQGAVEFDSPPDMRHRRAVITSNQLSLTK